MSNNALENADTDGAMAQDDEITEGMEVWVGSPACVRACMGAVPLV